VFHDALSGRNAGGAALVHADPLDGERRPLVRQPRRRRLRDLVEVDGGEVRVDERVAKNRK
jgi:hypothetical protein